MPPDLRRFETRLLLALAGIVLLGMLGLALIRPFEESVWFDLSSGAMRADRRVFGFQYASEPIESGLDWLALLEAPRPGRWLPISERHDGSLLRQPLYQRRIGQVYLDACVMAQVLCGRDRERLRLQIRRIAAADAERIWPLRQELRQAYERQRPGTQAARTVDQRPRTDTTNTCPNPATR